MIYDAVYGMSSNAMVGLIAVLIMAVLVFLIVLFGCRWAEGVSWRNAVIIALLFALVATIVFTGDAIRRVTSFREEILANPEYQRILDDARTLDIEANKLLERARKVRKQIKEKNND